MSYYTTPLSPEIYEVGEGNVGEGRVRRAEKVENLGN